MKRIFTLISACILFNFIFTSQMIVVGEVVSLRDLLKWVDQFEAFDWKILKGKKYFKKIKN